MDAKIVGWGHTPFGRKEGDLEALICEAAAEALRASASSLV